MGFFDKLFGNKQTKSTQNLNENEKTQFNKGEKFISTGENFGYKIIRDLTEEQKEHIEKSTILLRSGQLYMHYWTDNLVCKDRNDQEWQNKVMFFWKAEEPFPKKSLPPTFETFKVKYFLFQGDTSKVSLQVGQAMPWFGMPGLGEKHVCELNNEKVTIPELYELGLIEYVEQVELTNNNFEILTDRENYMFLIDERITPFENGNFHLDGKPIPINVAYSVGGIHIMKKTELE
ncbi:hypothetical protein JSO54_10245 [Riemerella anatipestifer]|uniref:glycohydrolase toxin TNT-related protein n=1 Tax=Riemerella anatipestifer TaxID=34085 RepID=UPI0030C2D554